MIKKILAVFLVAAICSAGLFSCKKVHNNTVDPTRNYFPLTFGKYVTYAVDSTYYVADTAHPNYSYKLETRCQLKYQITDTFTDSKNRLSYILDIYYRPYAGADWTPSRVVYVTPTANSILYSQDGVEYIKLMFPVQNGLSWAGNQYAQVQDSMFSYLKGWNYTYQNYHLNYFNGLVNYDNTVTVLEDDENVNFQNVDSLVGGYRTYAKEVYAYNVGMVYKEWTHYTWATNDSSNIKSGYTVIMQAIDNH